MRKTACFPPRYWQSELARSVLRLGHHHQTVMTYLVTGPHSHLSGIYSLQVYQLAEDLSLDPDEARGIITTLENLGWCMYERPVIWVQGIGGPNDQLGCDFRDNASHLVATLRHIESLPEGNAAVIAWRAAHDLTGVTADAVSQQHPRRRGRPASTPPQAEGMGIGMGKGMGKGIGKGTVNSSPRGTPRTTPRRTTRATTGKGALREGQP